MSGRHEAEISNNKYYVVECYFGNLLYCIVLNLMIDSHPRLMQLSTGHIGGGDHSLGNHPSPLL